MKTITEFDVSRLKNAAQIQQELLTAGKTSEEMPQALGEALKLEGDSLNHLLNALAVTESSSKKLNELKRVIVLSLSEGEKAPSQTQQKGEHYYTLEYYPPLRQKNASKNQPNEVRQGRDRDQKKGKRGEKRGKPRNNRGERQDRGPRGPRAPRIEGAPTIQPLGASKPLPVIKPKDTTPKDSNPAT